MKIPRTSGVNEYLLDVLKFGGWTESEKIIVKWLASSFLVGRMRGMEIRFHISTLFSLLIAYYIFRPTDLRSTIFALLWLVGFILCILLHEMGHALTASLLGVEVKSVVIWLLGGFTNLRRRPDQPAHRLAISAAGPLVNMLLAFLCVVGYLIFYLFLPRNVDAIIFLWGQSFFRLFFSLALLNVILVVFNLLPVYPLDGGNILHAFAELFVGRSNADLITMLVSIPFLLALVAFGLFSHDYLLLATCILIALAIGTLNHSALRWLNLGLNYLFKRAGYYYLQGDYERAALAFTRDIDRDPSQANNYIARAGCYLNMLQKERALADVERALRVNPNSLVALQLRGEISVLDKDYDAALGFFDRAQEVNPHWAVPHFDRGSVLLEKGEYQAALEELDQAAASLSQMPLFFVVRSLTHYKLGNLEASHNDQDAALRLSEKEALTMADINLTIYEGFLDWAEDYYTRAIALRRRSAFAYQGHADAYRVNKEYQKAIINYTRAIELNPREPRPYLGRGKCYQALNMFGKAAADFQQAAAETDKLHLRRQAEDLAKAVQRQPL